MVLSESRSLSRSHSRSDEYEDMRVGRSNQHVCTTCCCSEHQIASGPQNYYETMQFLLNQFAREDSGIPELEDVDEQEPASHYYRGGYHVLRLGDTLKQQYLVYRKLGWDELSTKWLARDLVNDRYVTVTIFKASEMHMEFATNLIRTFNKIQEHPCERIMKLLDHFQVSGVNGTHICLVTEVMAECLNNYMIRQNYKPAPLSTSKVIVRQILEGIHHLHTRNKLVHTNIKPESIFIKADKAFVMNLVYKTYVTFKGPVLPISFVCNLPSRLVHLRTNIGDLSREIFLLDKEFETFYQSMRKPKVSEDLDLMETSMNETGEGDRIIQEQIMLDLNKAHANNNNNTLMGRLSRFIKCKMNLHNSNKKYSKKCTSKLKFNTKRSSSRSSNSTNYESTSVNSSTSPSSNIAIKNSSEESGRNVRDNNNIELVRKRENKNQDEKHGECIKLAENLENLEITENDKHSVSMSSSGNINDQREISADETDIESQVKAMQVYLAETIIEEWYSYNNGQLQELGEKCDTIQSQIKNEFSGSPQIESEQSCLNLITTKDDQVTNVTVDEPQHETDFINEDKKLKNEGDKDSNSDFLDEITTSSESSENEDDAESTSNRPSRSESFVKSQCGCQNCRKQSHRSQKKEDEGSQKDSSYSTSTSTQQSFTEFLLNYCKHNNLCLEFSQYMQDARLPEENPERSIEVVITDLEHARAENDVTICEDEIQRQYRAIELIYTNRFDAKIDIWSVACLTFELVTGDFMFNPTESKYYTIDEHHMLKAIQLLAEMPPGLMDNERSIRNIKLLLERDCATILRLNAKENFFRALSKSYRVPKAEAKQLTRLLVPMLRLNPAARATAEQCLKASWLSST